MLNNDYELVYRKLVNQEKENERLKTTYEVVRQQEIEKEKENSRVIKDKQIIIADLSVKNQDLSIQNGKIFRVNNTIETISKDLKDAKSEIERLQIDKDSLSRIINSSNYEEKLKNLEQDLTHTKQLLENERRSRQSITDTIDKKDLHLEDLERINYELGKKLEGLGEVEKKKDEENVGLKYQIQDLTKENESLQTSLSDQNTRIKEMERDLAHCGECYDTLEKEMSVLKAKEYDRIGNGQTILEKEKAIRELEYEKEMMAKELERAKGVEEELKYFKEHQDENFKVFEGKFEEISKELMEMQNENNGLKIRESTQREKIKSLIREKDDLLRKLHDTENIDTSNKDSRLVEIEGMLKNLTVKSNRDSHEDLRRSIADQTDKEKKVEIIHDLQERIQKFKDDYNRKKSQKDYFINE